MAASQEPHRQASQARADVKDEDDNVSIGSLMKKGKKSHAAKLEDRLRVAHVQSSSPPVTVKAALDMIDAALTTLKTQLENSNSNSVRKCLTKLDEGLRGLRSKTQRTADATTKKATSSSSKLAITTTSDAAPHTSTAMDDSSSLAVTLKRQKSPPSTAPPPQPSHRAFQDDVVHDLSSVPLDPSLPQGVSLQLAFTPDSFCDGIRWPVVMFESFDVAKAWGMDVTMLELMHPTFDTSSDRVLFYFARANTMQDLNQLAVLSLDEAAPIAWTLDAAAASSDGLFQLAMQQAAQLAAALCPLHAIEWLAHCGAAAASYEFWTHEQLVDATTQLKATLAAPAFTESQVLLYAAWPILQDKEGWTLDPSTTTGAVVFIGADRSRHTSRLAALRHALASTALDVVHQVVWSYLRNAQVGRELDQSRVECLGRQYDSVQDAVMAYFAGSSGAVPVSPRGAMAAAAAAADDVSEIHLDAAVPSHHAVAMDQVLAVLVSTEYGWSESSDSVGHMYCQPSYATAASPVLGTDFFRTLTDVELYLTSCQRDTWDRIVQQLSSNSATPSQQLLASAFATKRPPPSSAPPPKAKKRKATETKPLAKSEKPAKFVATFANVFAYLESKGWRQDRTDTGHAYYKPNTDVATAEPGKTMFASADELETHLKSSSVWYRVVELLEQEHNMSALLEGNAGSNAAPKPAKPKAVATKAAPKPKKAPRVSSRSMVVVAAAPEFKPTFSKVYSELQKEGWFHRNGQFGWCYYKPGTVVKQAKLNDNLFSNEVHLEQYLKASGEWQRVVDQKNRQLQEFYGFYPPEPPADGGGGAPP